MRSARPAGRQSDSSASEVSHRTGSPCRSPRALPTPPRRVTLASRRRVLRPPRVCGAAGGEPENLFPREETERGLGYDCCPVDWRDFDAELAGLSQQPPSRLDARRGTVPADPELESFARAGLPGRGWQSSPTGTGARSPSSVGDCADWVESPVAAVVLSEATKRALLASPARRGVPRQLDPAAVCPPRDADSCGSSDIDLEDWVDSPRAAVILLEHSTPSPPCDRQATVAQGVDPISPASAPQQTPGSAAAGRQRAQEPPAPEPPAAPAAPPADPPARLHVKSPDSAIPRPLPPWKRSAKPMPLPLPLQAPRDPRGRRSSSCSRLLSRPSTPRQVAWATYEDEVAAALAVSAVMPNKAARTALPPPPPAHADTSDRLSSPRRPARLSLNSVSGMPSCTSPAAVSSRADSTPFIAPGRRRMRGSESSARRRGCG